VHIHSTIELSNSILKPIYKNNIPVVRTIHDFGCVCPVMGAKDFYCHKCFSKSVFNCIKNKCSKSKFLPSLYVAVRFLINKYQMQKYPAKCYISPSKILKEQLVSAGIKSEIKVIPNPLDTAFSGVQPNYNNKECFLYAGGLLDIKGVNVLLEAFKNLPENIELRIIGEGIQEKNYKQFVTENNLKNIKFLGAKNRKELIEEYQNCIALIVPSNWFEIFGMINIEAGINGKPVIASNIGGIPEIIEDGVNGLLFEPGNVEQLKDCILKYWNNSELVKKHGKNAYQKVISKYTEEKYYNELLEVYEEVLNEK